MISQQISSSGPPTKPQTPLGLGSGRSCVYGFNMCTHTHCPHLLYSLSSACERLKWCHTTQAQGQPNVRLHFSINFMCFFLSFTWGGALAVWILCVCVSFVTQPQSSNTNTLSHHKPSAGFIDLAMNQLVNYLISKALWVSAELLPACSVPRSL